MINVIAVSFAKVKIKFCKNLGWIVFKKKITETSEVNF
jgi:hypothetical protein